MKQEQTTKEENVAKAVGRNLSISTKDSIEISREIKRKNVNKAKSLLERVAKKESVLPLRRYHGDRGHKRGMAAGRYPIKASREILKVLKSAESNAASKGLNTSRLYIRSIIPNMARRNMRYGRKRGVKEKSTHIEIFIEEGKQEEDKKKPQTKKQESATKTTTGTKKSESTKKETQEKPKQKQGSTSQKQSQTKTQNTSKEKSSKTQSNSTKSEGKK